MKIVESILTNNPCFKAGKKIKVRGLMLHSVGCPQPSAEVFVHKWNSPDAARACVHAFIDGNTGKIYQTLPWNHRAWHGGGSSNDTHIGVEMCEPACIKYTGGSSFTCSNKQEAMAVAKCTYKAAVELFAFLCKKFNLNPLEDGVIVSHKEGHSRGIASGHGDPEHFWKGLQTGYTMDGFRKDVSSLMGENKPKQPTSEKSGSKPKNANAIHPGDTVTLTLDAVYYTGKEIPDWIKNDKWIVKSISGDRVVIDKNVSGNKMICSPVNIKYLKPIGSVAGKTTSVPKERSEPVSAASKQMTISDKGVELVAKYEGCRLEAYKCPAGVWTIGYGHTAGVKPGDKLPSQKAAKNLLKKDLKKYGDYVNDCVKKGFIKFPLNQNQFDALTSFCYNCGNGSLQKLVFDRNAATIAEKMLLYNKGGGKVLPGLARRREEERNLFLS